MKRIKNRVLSILFAVCIFIGTTPFTSVKIQAAEPLENIIYLAATTTVSWTPYDGIGGYAVTFYDKNNNYVIYGATAVNYIDVSTLLSDSGEYYVVVEAVNSVGGNTEVLKTNTSAVFTYTDNKSPVISEVLAERTGKTEGKIVFNSNEKGTYYYAVGASPNTSTDGNTCAIGNNKINLNNIDTDEKQVKIIVKDSSGNTSSELNVTIPKYIHTHTYDKEVVDTMYLKREATCETPSIYYKSCECGQAGSEIFTSGSSLDHDYTKLENDGVEQWYECAVCRKEKPNSRTAYNAPVVTYGIAVDDTNFPDTIFRGYVSNNIDKDSDGYISNDEIVAVKSINVNSLGVSDMTGVAYFTEITYLGCNDNPISTLDVSKNTKLEEIHCCNTDIATLDLSKNVSLVTLSANKMPQLSSLDISTCTLLESLDVGETLLTSMDLSDKISLISFKASGSKLEYLKLPESGALDYINVDKNHLTHLELDAYAMMGYATPGSQTKSVTAYDGVLDMSDFGDVSRMENITGGTMEGNVLTLNTTTGATTVTYKYATGNLSDMLTVTLNVTNMATAHEEQKESDLTTEAKEEATEVTTEEITEETTEKATEEKEDEPVDSPKTGDSANIWLVLGILIISGGLALNFMAHSREIYIRK